MRMSAFLTNIVKILTIYNKYFLKNIKRLTFSSQKLLTQHRNNSIILVMMNKRRKKDVKSIQFQCRPVYVA